MKNKNVDCLHDMVGTLCRQIDDPSGLTHLYEIMVAVIELARTDRAWRAMVVASEVVHHLAIMLEERSQVAPAPVERFRIHADGYGEVRPEPTRPVATIDQMRAAADAAMAAEEDMDEYTCDVCHKVTIVPMDSGTPMGWTDSGNPDGEDYRCVECSTFGVKP